MKIIIYSPYDCLIRVGENESFLDQNEHLIIEESEREISVFPTNKNSHYSFLIDVNNFSSPFYAIVKQNDNLLVFLMDGLIAENVDIFSFSHKDFQLFSKSTL